ncbi:MAG: S9 family peptidase [Planctomycetota bacterium]|jgi:dipeptidyl aminopeptidase/acylaminoacyl peptidase
MNAYLLPSLALLLPLLPAQQGSKQPGTAITLERIMADPDWYARSPGSPYWADDSKSFYWSQKRLGSGLRDLVQSDLAGRELRRVSDAERPAVDVPGGNYSEDGSRKVYTRNGDLFVKELSGSTAGRVMQLTRTSSSESQAIFLAGDRRIAFRRDGQWFMRDLDSGLEAQLAELKTGEDPDAEDDEDKDSYLERQNRRLSKFLQERKERSEEAEESRKTRRDLDHSTAPRPFYLGKGLNAQSTSLSPDGRWLVVSYGKRRDSGKRDSMPVWVTDSSYVEPRPVRSLVGTGKPAPAKLALLDLKEHRRFEIDLESLPGIKEDPLAAIRASSKSKGDPKEPKAENGKAEAKEADKKKAGKPKARPVSLRGLNWNADGSRFSAQAFSPDNKDRWTFTIAVAEAKLDGDKPAKLKPAMVERRTDPAWIGRIARQSGWLEDGQFWFQSEASGYSHLYLHDPATKKTDQLTSGSFEVTSVTPDLEGRYLYFRANLDHPGITEIHRLETATRKIEQITNLGGMNTAQISPDGSKLLITHSALLEPPEIYVQDAAPTAQAIRLTHTTTDEFESLPWIKPQIVEVPNENGRPIYTRLYLPPGDGDAARKRPAVFFVHGAGYLQNSHQGWSNYFREFMFHSMLAHRGYVVMDMDYRASAGYGRDWRTAIYRQMGTPELADLKSGVSWVVENHAVDAENIGVYGGSYGGFMTLMAMFRAPELFAAGAALRPVTDWAHYNHGYTSNILNNPEDDPEAYEISSPIEFAEGLEGNLLICHGMLDDNVFFKDSVRLAQRLIELEKENWEMAVYPVERHGFQKPSSWLDEYRRIYKLFETSLR